MGHPARLFPSGTQYAAGSAGLYYRLLTLGSALLEGQGVGNEEFFVFDGGEGIGACDFIEGFPGLFEVVIEVLADEGGGEGNGVARGCEEEGGCESVCDHD